MVGFGGEDVVEELALWDSGPVGACLRDAKKVDLIPDAEAADGVDLGVVYGESIGVDVAYLHRCGLFGWRLVSPIVFWWAGW